MYSYTNVTDNQIAEYIVSPDNLIIAGQTGSGKTRLINRILRYLDNQADYVYVFLDGLDMANHTSSGYGHIQAEHFKLSDFNDYEPCIKNIAIACSELEPCGDFNQNLEAISGLLIYIGKLVALCAQSSRPLIVVADELTKDALTIIRGYCCNIKSILSVIRTQDLEFQLIQL